MKHVILASLLLFPFVVLISESSCAIFSPHPTWAQQMHTLGDQLLDLTAAVQGAVSEDPAGTAGLSDRELLARATADDPALLRPFAGYSVRTSRAGNFVSVLVCAPDGTRGLLEDTNCTKSLDRELWRQQAAACQPTVQLAAVCHLP